MKSLLLYLLLAASALAQKPVETLTEAEKSAMRAGIGAAGNHIAFYDRFDDLTRYKEGATLTTGVTLPRVGNPWHLSYTVSGVANGARVVNGKIQLNRDSGYYLGANATLGDVTNWSMGVEFIREATFLTASSTNNFTLAFGPPNIVLADGSGIQISGNPHINMREDGINSVNMNFGQTEASGSWDSTTDEITTVAPHTLETNDMVGLSGTLPGGTVSTINYYVIKISNTVVKLALKREDVVSLTAVNLTNSGSTVNLGRAAECLNRVYANGVHGWVAPVSLNYLVQGASAGDTLATNYTHSIVTGDVIMLEGAGLPAPLLERTPYYAIYAAAKTIQVSATPGGSAIDLTTNGSASQLLRTARRDLLTSIPYGRRSIVTFRVKGDFFQVTLEGVGTVEYYYRNLAAKIPSAMSFYWQSPGASFLGTNYHSTYSATAIWVDAPQIEEQHTRRLPGSLVTAGENNALTGQLQVVDSKRMTAQTLALPGLTAKAAIIAGASTLTALSGTYNANVGGNIFADGNFIFNPGFTEFNNANQMALAVGSVDQDPSNANTFASLAGGSTTAVIQPLTAVGMVVGYMEEFEICGTMTGAGAKRLLVDVSVYGGTIFDSNVSGTPLNALTVPWRLKILRKSSASFSHTTYATLEYNGAIIGPQRYQGNVASGTPEFRNIGIKLITDDAGGMVIEAVKKTVYPVKLR